jgi:hypothetical protein
MYKFRKFWYKLLKRNPAQMKMVKYWKFKEAVAAKVVKGLDGSIMMQMEGEDYPFPTFPRGYLLYGPLSKLKHEIKNQIFNDSWKLLEEGKEKGEIIKRIKDRLFGSIAEIADTMKYDMLPPSSMTLSVREIHRAWTKVAPSKTYPLRDYLCLILQEDDGYRMRCQWLVTWFGWLFKFFPVNRFEYSLKMLEIAEVIGDMKERIRLLRRILMLVLEDKTIRKLFEDFVKEADWSKIKLTEGDKYHFRGKWFKVDLNLFDY